MTRKVVTVFETRTANFACKYFFVRTSLVRCISIGVVGSIYTRLCVGNGGTWSLSSHVCLVVAALVCVVSTCPAAVHQLPAYRTLLLTCLYKQCYFWSFFETVLRVAEKSIIGDDTRIIKPRSRKTSLPSLMTPCIAKNQRKPRNSIIKLKLEYHRQTPFRMTTRHTLQLVYKILRFKKKNRQNSKIQRSKKSRGPHISQIRQIYLIHPRPFLTDPLSPVLTTTC